jgi:hypothetical protein
VTPQAASSFELLDAAWYQSTCLEDARSHG